MFTPLKEKAGRFQSARQNRAPLWGMADGFSLPPAKTYSPFVRYNVNKKILDQKPKKYGCCGTKRRRESCTYEPWALAALAQGSLGGI